MQQGRRLSVHFSPFFLAFDGAKMKAPNKN